MARLTKAEWAAARIRWESDLDMTFAQLSVEIGVSRPAVSKMAKDWVKGGSTPKEVKPANKVTGEVTPSLKVTAKVTKKVTPEVTGPAPVPLPVSRNTEPFDLNKLLRPVGRPSLYQETYPELMLEYFKEYQPYTRLPLTNGSVHYSPNPLPTFTKFAEMLGICDDTLRNWAKARNKDGLPLRPEFFGAYARARKIQEDFIVECGLVGAFNPATVSLLLKNCHGYEDMKREEIDVTANKRSVEEVEAAIIEGMRKTQELQKTVEGRFYRITGQGSPPIDAEINNQF